MFGQNFDPKLFDSPQARASCAGWVDRRTGAGPGDREGQRLDLATARREVIKAIPAFQQDGKFNYERYKTLLAAQGQSEQYFEQTVRTDLLQQTLVRALADSSLVPRSIADNVQRLAEEEREIRELRFRVEDFVPQVKVTDAAISDYYNANKPQFETAESVRAEYVVLTLDSVASQITVPESELRAYYDQNKSRYGTDEQRRASHILFTVGESGTAKDKDGARKVAEGVSGEGACQSRRLRQARQRVFEGPGLGGQWRRPRRVRPRHDGEAVRGGRVQPQAG